MSQRGEEREKRSLSARSLYFLVHAPTALMRLWNGAVQLWTEFSETVSQKQIFLSKSC